MYCGSNLPQIAPKGQKTMKKDIVESTLSLPFFSHCFSLSSQLLRLSSVSKQEKRREEKIDKQRWILQPLKGCQQLMIHKTTPLMNVLFLPPASSPKMADPEVDHGFIYNEKGQVDILKYPFFDFTTDED
ncbi:hypothetical protein M5K25_001389 [Dendrobium thyrsiflorum]|uniref:Uncharacterized protein n=1 Tax=Dendrobium thyrsiflorum TaxID=117978 RepID=A0ABD0VQ86_DENTH